MSAGAMFAAAVLAAWTPQVLGPRGPTVIRGVVAALYLLGVAINYAVLLWLTRGSTPRHDQPSVTTTVAVDTVVGIARMIGACLISAAVAVRVRRTRS